MRQQRGGNGEDDEADQDAFAAVDLPAEIADGETGKCHAERAGIDGKAHGGGADAIMPRQRGQDGLGGEQIDHGEESRERDDEEAERGTGGVFVLFDGRRLDGMSYLSHGAAPRTGEQQEGMWRPLGGGDATSNGGSGITCSCRSDP